MMYAVAAFGAAVLADQLRVIAVAAWRGRK